MMYLGDQAVGLATSIPTFGDKMQIEYGEYTPTTDEDVYTTYISHSLGKEPDFIIFTSDSFDMVSEASIYAIAGTVCKHFKDYTYDAFIMTYYKPANSTTTANARGNGNISQFMDENHNTNMYFRFIGPTNAKLKANVKYHYIVGYFKDIQGVTPIA